MRLSKHAILPATAITLRPLVKWVVANVLLTASLFAADATYDGAKVHYESYGKGKEAVVFIHGWTCDLTFSRGQAPVYGGAIAIT